MKWTRTNIAHLLAMLKKRAVDLGRAKAHYRTCELGKLHDEIAKDLAEIVSWVPVVGNQSVNFISCNRYT